MSALPVILAVLATLRISLMITQEEGPFGIFTRLRDSLDPDQRTWLGRGVNCAWCVSFWVAWLVALLLPWSTLAEYALLALGLSGATVVIKKMMDKR